MQRGECVELKRNLVLSGIETFSKGTFENTALADDSVVLDGVAGRNMLFGCYTTPQFLMPAFSALNVSWNALTPSHTVVEAQCRVLAGGEWSGWMSFGKWSPEYPRKSPSTNSTMDNMVFCVGDTITVAVPGGGTAAQLRMNLYSDDEKVTPALQMMAVAARPLEWERQAGTPLTRSVYLPAYTLATHDHSFGLSMDLPITVAAMMNRYGEDALPEELAYGMSDGATAACHNAAYAAAMAGCCGYPCWQAWADLKDLRRELRTGNAVAVELRGKNGGTRWAGLHGFAQLEAPPYDTVLLCDPAQEPADRTMPLQEFLPQFTGRTLLLRRKPRGVSNAYPQRIGCTLKPTRQPGKYRILEHSSPWLLPEDFDGWLAASPHGGVAHATTANREFFRLERGADGCIVFPAGLCRPGARYSVYMVDRTGTMRVAELRMADDLPEPEPPAAEPAAAPAEKINQ